jgi:mono/diheme cytochrome c family protein
MLSKIREATCRSCDMDRTFLVVGVIFLLSTTAPVNGSMVQDEGHARKLINSQGCKACHSLENDGGNAAPSFEEMRARLSRQEIRLKLTNPAHRHGNGRIPDFSNLQESEIEALVVFIQPTP